MKKSQEYVEQPGCHDCRHCFIKYDYDAATTYYCAFGAPRRPRCGSVCMKEFDGETAESDFHKFDKWAKGREVKAWGMCWEHRSE